ncbi:MAG: hypothetical protein WA885_13225 [Phormidesmis sp.]
MLSETEILQRYSERGFVQSSETYLPPSVGLAVVDECQKNDLAVISVETFVLENTSIQPKLDLIADYSSTKATRWHDYRDICNNAAKLFLMDLLSSDKFIVSFVIESQSEWLP